MPATLRCPGPSRRSLGHLSPHGTSARLRTASCAARPARSVSQPSRDAETPSGRSSTLTVSPDPGGETQLRASRPRPASWCSATSTVRSGAPAAAAASRSAFVEPVRSTKSTRAQRPTSAARTASWSSGRAIRFMRPDATAVPVVLRISTRATSDQWARSVADRRDGDRVHAVTGRFRLRGMTAADVSSGRTPRPISTPPRASWPTSTGATRPWRPTRRRPSASTPRAATPPASAWRCCSTPARSSSSTPSPGTAPPTSAWSSAARSATASSPAPARSTAGRSPCSARTPRCSAARSARCTARRSSR